MKQGSSARVGQNVVGLGLTCRGDSIHKLLLVMMDVWSGSNLGVIERVSGKNEQTISE